MCPEFITARLNLRMADSPFSFSPTVTCIFGVLEVRDGQDTEVMV
jgi:hypothetical protein